MYIQVIELAVCTYIFLGTRRYIHMLVMIPAIGLQTGASIHAFLSLLQIVQHTITLHISQTHTHLLFQYNSINHLAVKACFYCAYLHWYIRFHSNGTIAEWSASSRCRLHTWVPIDNKMTVRTEFGWWWGRTATDAGSQLIN